MLNLNYFFEIDKQVLLIEKLDSKENIEASGYTYVREDPFYLYYRKNGLLYIFDARRDVETDNHKILAVLEDWN